MNRYSAIAEAIANTQQILFDDATQFSAVADSGPIHSDPDPLFDVLYQLTADTIGAPIALLTILNAQRQFFKAPAGAVFSIALPWVNRPWSRAARSVF